MLIVHSHWMPKKENESACIALWAEKDVPSQNIQGKRKKGEVSQRGARGEKVQMHPFCLDAPGLLKIMAESSFSITDYEKGNLTLSLPSVKETPIPSSGILDVTIPQTNKLILKEWTVPCLLLSPIRAVEFFAGVDECTTLDAGVILGQDVIFWQKVFRYAAGLVLKQQLIPSIERRGTEYLSLWEPNFTSRNINDLTRFCKVMPPVLRAVSCQGDFLSSGEIVSSFMKSMVDGLARISIIQSGASFPVKKGVKFESVHDAWLASLRSDSPKILFEKARVKQKKAKRPDGDVSRLLSESPLEIFLKQLSEWKRPLHIASGATFRMCFRLEEPDGEDEKWFLQYLLQASDDPSLIVPARQIWQETGKTGDFLNRKFDNPQERLLSALGRATSVFTQIEESLKAAMPDGLYLETQEAYRFLIEASWVLEQSGFGIILPSWWSGKGTGQKLHMRAKVKSQKMKGISGMGLSDLISFNWEAAVGTEKLSLQEFQHLARLKSPLVKVKGQWVELNAEEIRAAINLLKSEKDNKVPLSEIIKMSFGYTENVNGVRFEGVDAEGRVADVLDRLAGIQQIGILETPKGFSGVLRPYQQRGYSWLNFLKSLGLGACLADDMGLGKTVQALVLFLKDKMEGQKAPVLLICPTSVVGNWQREASRFAHDLRILVHHGMKRIKGDKFKEYVKGYDVVISSYALVHRDAGFLSQVRWGGIVLDEAQNVKNPETKQSKAVRSLTAGYRIALTGTPVENNIGDFWAIMEFLNPGFLGNQTSFRRNFFLPIQLSKDKEAISRLKHLTKPFVLRRVKTDKSIISDLPEKMEMKVFVNLTKEQASLYQAIVNDVEQELDAASGIQRKGLIFATLVKLKQVCNHPAHLLGDNSAIQGRSGKLNRLKEMLEEVILEDDKALVFTQFTEMGEIIKKYLQETFAVEVPFLHGGVAKKNRDIMVERFQNNHGRLPVFLLSLKAGGTGLNLTAANHVFHFDRWWNPSVENQATDRVFRIGQKKNVQVHKFICQGTFEEKIDEMLERKKEIAEGVIGTGEDWITELDTDQLKELFALRKNAVVI